MLQSTYYIDNFLNNFFGENTVLYPTNVKNDILKYNDRYELVLEVPGVSKENVNVKAEQGNLHIKFNNKSNYGDDAKLIFTSNRNTGEFEKTYLLPDDVDTSAITAICKDGVLTVKLPMKEKTKSVEISVI